MKRLKVAFFCWESLYSRRIGGLSPGATYLAEALAKKHEVHFFTRGSGEREIKGVRYHYCKPADGNIIDYSRDMCRQMVEQFRECDTPKFDVLHFHDWHVTEALAQLKDRNTVFTYHSTEFGRCGNRQGGSWESSEISGKEWYSGLTGKRITAVSNTFRSEVMRLYNVPDWKIDTVTNGIRPELYDARIDPGEVKKSYGIHPLAPVILFVGRMEWQKGPDLLADAIPHVLARRWDASFIFAGDGSMRMSLEDKTKGMPVRFPGYVSDSEYVRLLNASDVVVIPSRNEPFGLVLLEAWSARKCVVVSDVGGLSDNVENFKDGVKAYMSPESFAWGINHVLENGCKAIAYGKNGRNKIDTQFHWDIIADRMQNVYQKAVCS